MRPLLAALLLFANSAFAAEKPSELEGVIKSEAPAGCSSFSFLLWDLYDGALWTDASTLPGDHYALSLTYKSEFSTEELVNSSIEEMSRMSGRSKGDLQAARDQLAGIFPGVQEGDRITALRTSAQKLDFFFNGKNIGTQTTDVDLFMAIWLGPDSRDSDGRAALMGGGCG